MEFTHAQANQISASTKDEILPVFAVGQRVRLTKTIRNDGTYPYAANGEILVDTGAEGYVRKVGDFLQSIRVYEVNFIEEGFIFGCREAELEAVDLNEEQDEVEEELRWLREHRARRAAEKAEKEAAQGQSQEEVKRD